MDPADFERIKELKMAAKWSSDSHEKRQAISQLGQFGGQALPAIKEVLAVTAYDDIRQACIDAISALGRENKAPAKPRNSKRKAKAKKKRRAGKKA